MRSSFQARSKQTCLLSRVLGQETNSKKKILEKPLTINNNRFYNNNHLFLLLYLLFCSSPWSNRHVSSREALFKVRVVDLILKKQAEEAIQILSEHYELTVPRLKVGLPKKSRKKAACYVPETQTIHVGSRVELENPFVILHEFYHHLRMHGRKHLGTEKYADRFAREFIEAYQASSRFSYTVSYE